jgi:hypothetical protein
MKQFAGALLGNRKRVEVEVEVEVVVGRRRLLEDRTRM